jgi:hypothetical protein
MSLCTTSAIWLRVRGYEITENTTKKLLYFVDVDRTAYEVKVVDFTLNTTSVYEDIDELDDYHSTDGFDFLKVIKNPVYDPPQNQVEGWRYTYGPCFVNEDGVLVKGVYRAYYFLGVKLTKVNQVLDSGGKQVRIPCNESY